MGGAGDLGNALHNLHGPRKAAALALCVVGIYGSYLTQGVVSEELASKTFGPAQERFPHVVSLATVQAAGCFLFAFLILAAFQLVGGEGPKSGLPPLTAYLRPALTNSIGPSCGIQALKNVSYPAQVLAKSCKAVPVMLMGVVLNGRRYAAAEYASALLVAAGISTFALAKASSKAAARLAAPNAPLGYFLIGINLLFDGYTNAAQDALNHAYPGTTPLHMMCGMNLWTALITGAYTAGATSMAREVWDFCVRHPEAARDVALFCACGAVGQLFIFLTIKVGGSLACTTITTTRKFFNILLSVMWSGNPLLPGQWAGVAGVFAGLALQTWIKAVQRGRLKRKAE
ncbi:unnamed protein product [Pedinophyceae sp. YPF-701]|nr:unnamed protein product [Pedinophyceae sp. YPF-701]